MTYQTHADLTGMPIAETLPSAVPGSPNYLYRNRLKRTMDVVIVLLASLPVIALVGLLALIIMRDGHHPFYRQLRVGKDGRVFKMWKLRSMVPDAEAVLEAHLAANPSARAEWDLNQKLDDDPRITRFGRALRRSSFDELPQLWNVLRGDMSLVGPRPMMCSQRHIYPGTEYYLMRPGVTGFWQVSARNQTSFRERAEFDRAYYAAISCETDLRVLMRTVQVVLRATGR